MIGRKEKIVTIATEGRDKGKSFFLTEMPAAQAEWWATRVFLALSAGGIQIPDDIAQSGIAGISTLGLQMLGRVHPDAAKPLLDEMWQCVKFMGNPTDRTTIRNLIDDGVNDDIWEVWTRVQLRMEVFSLHTGFSKQYQRS